VKQDPDRRAHRARTPEGSNHRFSESPDGSRWRTGCRRNGIDGGPADLSTTPAGDRYRRGILAAGLPPTALAARLRLNATGAMDVAVVPTAGGALRLLTQTLGFDVPFECIRGAIAQLPHHEGGRTFITSVSPRPDLRTAPGRDPADVGHWSPDGSNRLFHHRPRQSLPSADSTGETRSSSPPKDRRPCGVRSTSWSPDGRTLTSRVAPAPRTLGSRG
jgi:hypothetical protein